VLEETAVQMVSTLKPAFTAAQMQAGIAAASKQYASQGVTTANEGATYAPAVAALASAGQSGVLPIRVIAWPVYDYLVAVDQLKLTSGKVKVGGVKDFSDGSIQGYTGDLSHPYHVPFNGGVSYHGAPRIVRDVLAQRVLAVHKAGRQSFIHGNGDEAFSDILFAYRNAQQSMSRPDARHTVIHSQMGTEAQLDDMNSLGVTPSFFVLHTHYWGDRHRDIFLGPERAERISPTKSALDRGMRSPSTPIPRWFRCNRFAWCGPP
jgi:predicted amidohydrolase YtcJ